MPIALHDTSAKRHRSRRSAREPSQAGLLRLFQGTRGERARFVLFLLMLVLVALCGGSSWPSAWPLLILRPGVVLIAAAIWIIPGPPAAPALRGPGLLLGALAGAIAVQLVPLPPSWWLALPGHDLFAAAADIAGAPQPWRPITLSVDATLNSLVALLVPGAVLVGAAALRADQRKALVGVLVGLAALSALLGLGQMTGAVPYFYALSRPGRPEGLFVNVNHQAAVLAAVIPLAAAWGLSARAAVPVRPIAAGAAGVLLLVTVLVSGSRGGLLLAAVAVLLMLPVARDRVRLSSRMRLLAVAGVAAAAIALVALVWAAGQLSGLDRLLGEGRDGRTAYLPIVLDRLWAFAPWGSGFGTFDAVFRQVEPDWALRLTYFNHAHNDLLELALTGGVAAVAVVVAYLVWLVRNGIAMFGRDGSEPLARAAFFAAALLLAASLVDYPLRTPLAGVVLALASLWVADRPRLPTRSAE